jgi:uncharacterized cupin superfamily protein
VGRTNVFSPEFDHESGRDGYRWRGAKVGKAVGGAQIGASVYELGDGQRTYPYHFHSAMEEWLVVLEGAPTLREPDGERVLRRGDVVCFPAGPEGAHVVSGPGTVMIVSANASLEVNFYPDSGKVASRPGGVFREADAVDYWDGE